MKKQYKQWAAKQNRPVAGDKVSGCLKRGINRVYTVYKGEKNRTQVKTSEDTAVPVHCTMSLCYLGTGLGTDHHRNPNINTEIV